MIPPLPVFGLVVNDAAFNLHLTGGVISLEVGRVIHGIPQAKLHIREEPERSGMVARIGESDPHQKAGISARHEELLTGTDPAKGSFENRIPQAVTAGIGVEFCLRGLPSGIPYGISFTYINMEAFLVERAVVVAVAGQAAQTGIPVKTVAARCIAEQGEEILTSQVIDPGQGRPGRRDHVLTSVIIEISVLHVFLRIS